MKKLALPPRHYATMYAEEWGWHLFPIKAMTKDKPLIAWSKYASNDPVTIAEWWMKWPTANIGLDCGRSGILVLDVDQHSKENNGAQSKMFLELEYGDLPVTLRSQTPTGGMHYFFKGTGRSTVGELGPGLDTRGVGGMVLLPGSRTDKGIYRWLP
jgi:hypothetical protein